MYNGKFSLSLSLLLKFSVFVGFHYFLLMFELEVSKPIEWLLYSCLLVGVAKVTITTLSALTMVAELTVLPKTTFKKYGTGKCWALVTGASDGLGAEYAQQLASKGFNVVLASRTLSKLNTIAETIEQKYNVKTKVVAADVSEIDSALVKIKEAVEGLPISILVNNVGQSHSIPVPFLETSEDEMMAIININNIFTLKLTQALIPNLKATAKEFKVRSLILTMGSFGGMFPTPYLAVYSGSKAFLQNWSASLSAELNGDNIDVEFVVSYLVASAMSKIRRTSALIPSPKNFVKSVLNNVGRRVGAQERHATSTPFWSHALMHFAVEQTVGVYSKVASSVNFSMHKDIRRRALRKAERMKKAE